jgi:hypothetical protein
LRDLPNQKDGKRSSKPCSCRSNISATSSLPFLPPNLDPAVAGPLLPPFDSSLPSPLSEDAAGEAVLPTIEVGPLAERRPRCASWWPDNGGASRRWHGSAALGRRVDAA